MDHLPEDGSFHIHHRDNIKSHTNGISFDVWTPAL
jgi:hypothetical protein